MAAVGGTQSVELGTKFRADVSGYVTGIRFYKGATNTGTHIGSLWTSTGTRLAQVTFSNETASGWQQANFATPVAITAGTTYVVSYFAPNGAYSVDLNYFASTAQVNAPLRALAERRGRRQRRLRLRLAERLPDETATAPATTGWTSSSTRLRRAPTRRRRRSPPTSPTAGATGVDPGGDVRATFSEPVDPATLTGNVELRNGGTLVPASVQYDAPSSTVTLHPTSALAYSTSYTATVKGGAAGVKDLAGNALGADVSWSFTTASQGGCPCSIWPASARPAVCGRRRDAVGRARGRSSAPTSAAT